MNNSLIVAILVGVVAVAGGAYYFLGGDDLMGKKMPGDDTVNTNSGEESFTGTMDDLLSRGVNVMCTVSSTDPNAQSEGVVYVAGNKMRGDFQSTTAAGTLGSSMIRDGEWMYTWTDAMPQGFKMKATVASGDSSTGMEGSGAGADNQYSYKCSSWSPDNSKFELPAGISFMEAPSVSY